MKGWPRDFGGQGAGFSRLSRTLLTNLTLIGGVSVLSVFLLLTALIGHAFGDLEQQNLQRNVERSHAFMHEVMQTNLSNAKDWGIWDDTFQYLNGVNPEFEARNLEAESFANAQVEGMSFVSFDKTRVHSVYFDNASGEARPELAMLLERLVTSASFRAKAQRHWEFSTFLRFGGRLYTLSCVQVFQSDHSGVSPGYLVFLNPVEEALISKALQVDGHFTFDAIGPKLRVETGSTDLTIFAPVFADDGKPVAMLKFAMPRTLIATGKHLRDMALLAIVGVVLAMLLVLSSRLRSLVLDPVKRLHRHVATIRETGEIQTIGGYARNDELGALQTEFNAMATELLALRAKYESQSFALGRSQSAIGTVHNLRNSLSPVNVLLSTVERALGHGIPPEAKRALDELANPGTPQERRTRLTAYLAALLEDFDTTLGEARGYTREAGRGLASALDTISGAQDPERIDCIEACELGALLGHAANTARYADGGHIEVSVDYPTRIHASGNRVLLSQVLDNLVTNAVEAIRASGREPGTVAISARQLDDRRCAITVRDSGDGFDTDARPQLFERGYSTRESKRGGLGLHWCANTLNAMGGRLTLASEGRGLGATATIELPLHAATQMEERAA